MSTITRNKTKYPGVYSIKSNVHVAGKQESIYYIRYRKKGKLIEEKVGRQFQDNMTAARANQIRSFRINGKEKSNAEKREEQHKNTKRWTIKAIWETYQKNNHSADNFSRDDYRLSKHVFPVFGNRTIEEINPIEVDKFRAKKLKSLAPATVSDMLSILRRLMNYGVAMGLSNPYTFKIKLPKVDNVKTEDLTNEQLSNLFTALEKDPDQDVADIMRIALFTGMRRGEILNLTWDDLDFERGFIFIKNPKGGKSINIPMNKNARTVFKNRVKTDSAYVFPGRYGGKRVEIRRTLNRIKKEAKLPPDFRPLHGLRHVFASHIASSGKVDMYTLQRLLTHKSPSMTQRYAHLRDEALRNASELAGNIMENIENED
ncbi:MAG: site-specific integrase [Candidatus Marinimicrobia bacterium]|nr:site-specific integrase [Candidatus Neomarinimicrobiota bacterium]